MGFSSSPSSSATIRMTASIDEKKKTFTLEKSQEAFSKAKELMPGGVNSPVRAFNSVGGQHIIMNSVKMSKSLAETMKKGTSFGAPCLFENTLAEMVISAVPSLKMVRFVNSGTEACMGVLRLARAFAGRPKIIKFEGCSHGHADPFLVKAGSGIATLGLPDSPGVPKAATSDTLTAPYNDISSIKSLFEEHKVEIAAIILEPVVGNAGFIPPEQKFLAAIRKITEENGALLIFNKVMTGFRLAYGGAQEYFGITPGQHSGKLLVTGTLSGNPLAMTTGIHTLKRLQGPGSYDHLDKITGELIQGILDAGKETGHAMCGGYIRGMFGFFFTDGPVHNFSDAKKRDTEKFGRFYRGMLEEGVYFAPSQFEAGFTSLAHTPEDIERTVAAPEKVLKQI
ncbi:unnamed protein product [Withania somnifera]